MMAKHSALALLLLAVTGSALAQTQFYRFVDEAGRTVMSESVPPEIAPKGYDIINRDGSLIRRVPRQLSEEELRLQNTEAARERLRQEEEQRLLAWDEMLMLRYSNIADIEAASERAERDLQIRISILKSNLLSVKSQIEREQQRAADIERSGREVPESIVNVIEQLKRDIEDGEESIAVRREEVAKSRASFQRDMDRFRLLSDRVKLRKK